MSPEILVAGCQPHPDGITLLQVLGALFCLWVIGQAIVESRRMAKQDACAGSKRGQLCWPDAEQAPKSCWGCRNVA